LEFQLKRLSIVRNKVVYVLEYYLNLRYDGTDNAIMVHCDKGGNFLDMFKKVHKREFGFNLDDRK